MPYVYDPEMDDKLPPDDEDNLHDPDGKMKSASIFGIRGFLNVGVLLILIAAIMALFVLYPVISFLRNNARNLAIDGNIRVNGTGQVAVL